MDLCPVCAAPSQLKCSGCTSSVSPAYYCSRDHQKQHWKHHKKECRPIVEGYGRNNDDKFWIASRDIREGSIILQEMPAISGPRLIPIEIGGRDKYYYKHVCLGCGGILGVQLEHKHLCTGCGWPVCGPECEKMAIHADNECPFLAKEEIAYPISSLELDPPFSFLGICALRGMFLKNRDPSLWKQMLATFRGYSYSSGSELLTEQEKKDSFRTRSVFKAQSLGSYEDWTTAFRMTLGNSFKEYGLLNEKPIQEVAVYPISNFFSHSCRPNAENTRSRVNPTTDPRWANKYGSTVRLQIKAIRPIRKGEPITVRFAIEELFYGTEQRLDFRKRNYSYQCNCGRCTDPTELGTFSSAIKCKNCTTGYMLPASFFDEKAPFVCSVCKHKKNREKVCKFIAKLHQELPSPAAAAAAEVPPTGGDGDVEDIEKYEEFITRNSGTVLHPNHWLLQIAIGGFCLALDPAYSPYPEDAEKALAWGRQLIKLRETLTPGLTAENAEIYLRVSTYGLLDVRAKKERLSEEEIRKRYDEMREWTTKGLKYWVGEEKENGGGGGAEMVASTSTTNMTGHSDSEQNMRSLLEEINSMPNQLRATGLAP